jgi:hypothetical protein
LEDDRTLHAVKVGNNMEEYIITEKRIRKKKTRRTRRFGRKNMIIIDKEYRKIKKT